MIQSRRIRARTDRPGCVWMAGSALAPGHAVDVAPGCVVGEAAACAELWPGYTARCATMKPPPFATEPGVSVCRYIAGDCMTISVSRQTKACQRRAPVQQES